ncbi:MAG: hypothetical protein IT450_17365 [Phycisphaerales bacterium]|nr:hypothetical protein [Phycisphaerales bacterium]
MIRSLPTIAILLLAVSSRLDAQSSGKSTEDVPDAIKMMERARAATLSGTVEWTITDSEREPGRDVRFINRYAANGDRVTEHRGDQHGWVGWDARENRPGDKFPRLYLQNGNGIFRTTETGPSVQWWLPKAELPEGKCVPAPDACEWMDIRSVGTLSEFSATLEHGTESFWIPAVLCRVGRDAPQVEWIETLEAGKHVVTCRRSDGVEITWTIDPHRGWNAERVVAADKGSGVTFEVRSGLRKHGETWFPERIELLLNGKPGKVINVVGASLNQPDDEPRFDFAWLRKEAGTNVSFYNAPNKDGVQIWDGEAIVSFKEWREALLSGKKQSGPTFQAIKRGEPPSGPYITETEIRAWERWHPRGVSNRLSAWEKYVTEFLERYKCDDDQTQKAAQILAQCQEQGRTYLSKKERDFHNLQTKTQAARARGNRDEQKVLDERYAELRKPIDDIFEEQLKPRLDKLLTRAQREQASRATTSQPVAGKEPPKDVKP